MNSESVTFPDGTVAVTEVQYGLLEVTDEFGQQGKVVEGWSTGSREFAEREVAKSNGRWALVSREVTTSTKPWSEVGSR